MKFKCIPREEGLELLAEIHGGICGSHIGSRALAGKAFRQGFFWPTALQDATTLVTKCEACQFHSKKFHQLAQALQTIPLSWLFSVWGLDILGPFPRAVGGFEYLYVAIDKFTKWSEVEPVRKVTTQSAVKFFKGHAVHKPHLHAIHPRSRQQGLFCFRGTHPMVRRRGKMLKCCEA